MKNLILVLVAFFPLLALSQKDFEGIITYKGIENNPKNTFEAKFFVSKGKIKVKTIHSNPEESGDRDFVIYDFIGGLEYYIDEKDKSFSVHSMGRLSPDEMWAIMKDASLTQKILGYRCSGYTIKPDEASLRRALRVSCWYSDSLKFTIPVKYRGTGSFASLPDGNMLFLKFIVHKKSETGDDKIETDSTFVEAIKIENMSLNESEFMPPADYTRIAIEEMEESTYPDTLLVDSSSVKELTVEEIKKEQPKKPPPPKSSTPSKSPAKKEKETKPVKG